MGGSPALRAALEEAQSALDRKADARETIVRLYGQLLREITPQTGSLTAATAEEIRQGHLHRLGVRPVTAIALTRVFEVARYSTHTISSELSTQFGVAVRRARSELSPSRVAG